MVDQFIDKTFKRTNTFFAEYGAVHVEMADPVCNRLREKIIYTGRDINSGQKVSKGTYVCKKDHLFLLVPNL